ncbi:hypothetical protein CTAYLR_002469 [Chrysophaeum taylorii]|uniref:Uncharacterized protein n=1 Tax=Chrysophaeum taylorii TaxID=2483200 RepID=A0AAD7ULY3_9STRA|nr:hypothetical protein CTAYLR_002469 [Chrysophaeum taylorii]
MGGRGGGDTNSGEEDVGRTMLNLQTSGKHQPQEEARSMSSSHEAARADDGGSEAVLEASREATSDPQAAAGGVSPMVTTRDDVVFGGIRGAGHHVVAGPGAARAVEGADDCDDEDYEDDDEYEAENDEEGGSGKRKAKPRRWTDAEDAALCQGVERYGERRWKLIAAGVGTRDHMQCLQRWKKVLKRGLNKTQWTTHEDAVIRRELEAHLYEHGDSSSIDWVAVAAKLPLRSVKECRERWKYSLSSLAVHWTQSTDGRDGPSYAYGSGLQPTLVGRHPANPTAGLRGPPHHPQQRQPGPPPPAGPAPRLDATGGAHPLDATGSPFPSSAHLSPGMQSPPTPSLPSRYVRPHHPPHWRPTERLGDEIERRLIHVESVMESLMREVAMLRHIVLATRSVRDDATGEPQQQQNGAASVVQQGATEPSDASTAATPANGGQPPQASPQDTSGRRSLAPQPPARPPTAWGHYHGMDVQPSLPLSAGHGLYDDHGPSAYGPAFSNFRHYDHFARPPPPDGAEFYQQN